MAVALGLATLVGYSSGVFWYVTDASRLRDLVLTMGPAGPIIFILMFSVLEAFGVPGLVFVGAAALGVAVVGRGFVVVDRWGPPRCWHFLCALYRTRMGSAANAGALPAL